MGCAASKDVVEPKSRAVDGGGDAYSQPSRSTSLPVQSQQNDGYHVVALTSSTYGILKVDSPKQAADNRTAASKSNSAEAIYEKLKHFDVPENMVSKPWSEVSLSLPKIPPTTKTESPRPPYQRTTKHDLETINMWELMDGLDEDTPGSAQAKLKPRTVERAVGSPVIKPFERSLTFSTIHTLRELDSGDPKMAIAPGPAGNFAKSATPKDTGRTESPKPFRPQSVSSPRLPKRDEIIVKLTPSSPSSSAPPRVAAASPRIAAGSGENATIVRPLQPAAVLKPPTPQVAATIKEVSNVLLPPPALKPVDVKPASSSQGGSKPPAPLQPDSPMVTAVKAPATAAPPEVAPPRAAPVSKVSSSPSLMRSASETAPGTQGTGNTQKTPQVSSLGRAQSEALLQSHGSSSPLPQVSSPGHVRAVAAALSQEDAGARSKSAPRGVVADSSANDSNRGVPRFASPIHVLSLAATFDLENRKNSLSPSDPKGPPMSPGPASSRASGVGQGRKQSSQHLSMPSPSLKAVSSSGAQGSASRVEIRDSTSAKPVAPVSKSGDWGSSKASAPGPTGQRSQGSDPAKNDLSASYVHVTPDQVLLESKQKAASPAGGKAASPAGKGASPGGKGVSPARKGVSPGKGAAGAVRRGASPGATSALWTDGIEDSIDPELLASFEEALEMFSADDWYNVRGGDGEAASVSSSQEDDVSSPKTASGVSRPEEAVAAAAGDTIAKGNKIAGTNAEEPALREAVPAKGPAPKAFSPAKKPKPDLWGRFKEKCPPAGEDRVVLYTTSLRGIRKTFEDCNNARFILQSMNVAVDERDVAMHAEFRQELKDLVGKPVPVPRVFIKGRYIGGMEELTQVHEDGTLATLVDGLPAQLSRGDCDGCGGVRFVPCSDCSGSCKVINEANKVVRCPECNENGLMRCPICY